MDYNTYETYTDTNITNPFFHDYYNSLLNNQQDGEPEEDWRQKYPYSFMLVIIIYGASTVLGLVQNIAVGVLIFTRKQFQSPSNIYILNRAIADFLVQCPLPLVIATWIDDSLRVGGVLCLFFSSAVEIGFIGSAWFLVFLSYDCYVCRRSASTSRWKVLLRATICIWVLAVLLTIPVYWLQKEYWETTEECLVSPIFHMVRSVLSLPILILLVIIPVILSCVFLGRSLRSPGLKRTPIILEEGKFKRSEVEEKQLLAIPEDEKVNTLTKDSQVKSTKRPSKDLKGRVKESRLDEIAMKRVRESDDKVCEVKKDGNGPKNIKRGAKGSSEVQKDKHKGSMEVKSTEIKREGKGKEAMKRENVSLEDIKGTPAIKIHNIKVSGIERVPSLTLVEVTRPLVAALTLTFIMCQVPYWSYHFCNIECGDVYIFYLDTALIFLLQLNQVINPLLWLGSVTKHSSQA